MTKNKNRYKPTAQQPPEDKFKCGNCGQMVFYTSTMGTVHRNHCNHCLWSLHVDTSPGDRKSNCLGNMKPIGLTFKHNGFDKYGNPRRGDIMLVHLCTKCEIININRIAADDPYEKIIEIFESSLKLDANLKNKVLNESITLLTKDDLESIETSFFGIGYK